MKRLSAGLEPILYERRSTQMYKVVEHDEAEAEAPKT